MKPEEIRQLLGGYASGTLSEAERKLLFEAALEDQVLFDAMADEQALKDLLDDPESRGYLQAVLDETEPAGLQHELYAPKQAVRTMAAPVPPQAVPQMLRQREPGAGGRGSSRRPAMWWGVLAAAGLAAVTVVGILQLNRPPKSADVVAKNETKGQSPADKSVQSPPKPVGGLVGGRAKDPEPKPRPAVASKTAKREEDSKTAVKSATEKESGPAVKEPAVANATTDRRAEAKQQEAEKSRDERTVPSSGKPEPRAAPPPSPAAPQQSPQRKDADQEAARANSQAPQDRLEPLKTQASPGARQQFTPREQQPPAIPPVSAGKAAETNTSTVGVAPPAGAPPRVETASKKAKGTMGNVTPTRTSAPALARAGGRAAVSTPRKTAFAIAYKVLRKRGEELEQVPPGAAFRAGDEVVLVIEKKLDGVVVIDRISDGTAGSVPLAIQTNELARSVPLMVNGPMELTLTFNRTGGGGGFGRIVPAQPAAGQKTEVVADGTVNVGDPAAMAGRALVVRVSIRVE